MSEGTTTWWRARATFGTITPVQVQRESESSVWINNARAAKTGANYCYFKTWEEAKAHLLEIASAKVYKCQYDLDKAEKHLAEIEALQKP